MLHWRCQLENDIAVAPRSGRQRPTQSDARWATRYSEQWHRTRRSAELSAAELSTELSAELSAEQCPRCAQQTNADRGNQNRTTRTISWLRFVYYSNLQRAKGCPISSPKRASSGDHWVLVHRHHFFECPIVTTKLQRELKVVLAHHAAKLAHFIRTQVTI